MEFSWDCIGSRKLRPNKLWERTLSVLSLKPLVRFLLLSTEQYSTIYIIIYTHIHIPIPIESVWTPAKSPRITCRYVTPPHLLQGLRCLKPLAHTVPWITTTIGWLTHGRYNTKWWTLWIPQKREIWYIDLKQNLMSNFGRVPWQ